MSSENVITVGKDNWETDVIQSQKPVLVDFWASWCGPCRALAPVLEELAADMGESLKIAKVDVDENRELAAQFGIRSIPTLLLFKQGSVTGQINGAMPRQDLQQKVQGMLDA